MSTPQIQSQEFRIEVPEQRREATAYVFHAGDLIDPALKSRTPEMRLGGVVKDLKTLEHQQGYLRRCEITQLRQRMLSEHANFVHPEQRKLWKKSYSIVEDGEVKTIGANDMLLRQPFFPADELPRALGANDGLVQMPIRTAADRDRAQRFLFPNWDGIRAGQEFLPATTAELRAHLSERLQEAMRTAPEMVPVCETAIVSCDQFRSWGEALIREQQALFDEAKTKGWAWTYGTDAELCFAQLGIQRQDRAVQSQAEQFNQLISALSKGLVQPAAPTAQSFAPLPLSDLKPPVEAESTTEPQDATPNLPSGTAVMTPAGAGTVAGMRFGKYEVEFGSGDRKLFAKDKVTQIEE